MEPRGQEVRSMSYLYDGCSLEGREHEHKGHSHHYNVPHSHITNPRHLAAFTLISSLMTITTLYGGVGVIFDVLKTNIKISSLRLDKGHVDDSYEHISY